MPPVGRGHKFRVDRDLLERLYVAEGRPLKAVAAILGCSDATVHARLSEYGIPRRAMGAQKGETRRPRFEIDVGLLRDLYVTQKRPAREIAAIVGCSTETASARIREAGLTRPRSELRGWKQSPEANKKRAESHKKLWDKRGRATPEHALHLQRAEWKNRAKECYERDGWLCRDCGVHCNGQAGPQKIQCHHIIPRALGGGDELANLVTLCNACHKTREWRSVGALFA